MTPSTKKWTRFFLVFGLWLFGDLATKGWADGNLASPIHPVPVAIEAAEVGRPISEVLKDRFGWDDATLQLRMGSVERLAPAVAWRATDSLFASGGPVAKTPGGARGLYIFWRDDPTLAPRGFDLLAERNRLENWLRLALGPTQRAEAARLTEETLGARTFADWLPEVFRKLDAEKVQALLANQRIHPIPSTDRGVSAATQVAAGDTFLVTDNDVDVMGDWWKFVYSENPGAAFGFLKGVSPDIRHTLFMLLTIAAFLVIGIVIRRLPDGAWFIQIAFAGILAGAVGNFIDRIRYGYVIDFIDMNLGFMHWPTFNVADIGISCGVIALVIDLTFNKKSALARGKTKGSAAPAGAAAKPVS